MTPTPAEPKYSDAQIQPFAPWPDAPSAAYVAERMCRLTSWVCERAVGFERASDCFCGKGGFWRPGFHGTFADGYRNQGDAVQWIEQACKAFASRPSTPDKVGVSERVVAGALFDLMGFLTTRDEAITLSGSHEASCAVQALEAFAKKRELNLDEADVNNWRTAITHFATQSAEAVRDG